MPIADSAETRRLQTLSQYGILDTPPVQELEDIAATAAAICRTPMAAITLIDANRQWYKTKVGFDLEETPRDFSFCAHVLDQREPLIVTDATKDERFARSPLVTGYPGIRFYAGAPLIAPDNSTLGSLCVTNSEPQNLTPVQQRSLQVLAEQVMSHFEQHRRRVQLNLDQHGELPPGIHDLTLDQLRLLVCTNPYRRTMWSRLMVFLAWPILNQQYSHAYIGGGLVQGKAKPGDIDVILETVEPYGAASIAALSRFFSFGLERILELYSVHLHFWMRNAPEGFSDYRTFFQYAPPPRAKLDLRSAEKGVVRINLRDPEIISKFHHALTTPAN